MGRTVTRLEDAEWYVPDIEDNRADPDPFCVQLTPLSGAELTKFERVLGKITRGREINAVDRAVNLRDRIIIKRVLEVRNYAVLNKKTGKVFEATDGTSLIAAVNIAGGSEVDLVLDDIVQACKNHSKLEEGILENLASQSASVSRKTETSGDGAANGADETNEQAQTLETSKSERLEIATA